MLENRFFFLIRKPLITQNLVLACWIVSSSILKKNACVLKFKRNMPLLVNHWLVYTYTEPNSLLKSGHFISETVFSCGGGGGGGARGAGHVTNAIISQGQ